MAGADTDYTAMILVNEPYSLKTIQQVLQRMGLSRIIEESDRARAEKRLQQGEIDLLLCDDAICSREGAGDYRHYRASFGPDLAIIMLCGEMALATVTQAARHNIQLLQKPVEARALLRVLAQTMGKETLQMLATEARRKAGAGREV